MVIFFARWKVREVNGQDFLEQLQFDFNLLLLQECNSKANA